LRATANKKCFSGAKTEEIADRSPGIHKAFPLLAVGADSPSPCTKQEMKNTAGQVLQPASYTLNTIPHWESIPERFIAEVHRTIREGKFSRRQLSQAVIAAQA
jgi:hypothetical protein